MMVKHWFVERWKSVYIDADSTMAPHRGIIRARFFCSMPLKNHPWHIGKIMTNVPIAYAPLMLKELVIEGIDLKKLVGICCSIGCDAMCAATIISAPVSIIGGLNREILGIGLSILRVCLLVNIAMSVMVST